MIVHVLAGFGVVGLVLGGVGLFTALLLWIDEHVSGEARGWEEWD